MYTRRVGPVAVLGTAWALLAAGCTQEQGNDVEQANQGAAAGGAAGELVPETREGKVALGVEHSSAWDL